MFFKHYYFIWMGGSATRFAGGFGARDYRQTAAGGNAGGFGGRGGRNQGGHGGARGFGGGKIIESSELFFFFFLQCISTLLLAPQK